MPNRIEKDPDNALDFEIDENGRIVAVKCWSDRGEPALRLGQDVWATEWPWSGKNGKIKGRVVCIHRPFSCDGKVRGLTRSNDYIDVEWEKDPWGKEKPFTWGMKRREVETLWERLKKKQRTAENKFKSLTSLLRPLLGDYLLASLKPNQLGHLATHIAKLIESHKPDPG
ncbi:MAG TPA: hypothetical protein VE973_02985 [Candidatus Limnocylindria bacterium]|nr:hypothetical protein [Candidatus Limnocylindria bacterium]